MGWLDDVLTYPKKMACKVESTIFIVRFGRDCFQNRDIPSTLPATCTTTNYGYSLGLCLISYKGTDIAYQEFAWA